MTHPEIVLVPGFWEGPEIYSSVQNRLENAGYSVTISPLISTGSTDKSMYDDIAATRKVLEGLIDQGKTIVLVGHSGGALVAAHATQGLDHKSRSAAGKAGGILKLAFVTGAIFPVGHEHQDVPFADVQGDKMFCQSPKQLLFNDMNDEEADKWVKKLSFQPAKGWNGKVEYAGWQEIPSAYLVCEKDAAIPPPLQEQLAGMASCNPVEKCDAGHCAPISQPDAVASFLTNVAKGVS